MQQHFIMTNAGTVPIQFGKRYVVLYRDKEGSKISYDCYMNKLTDKYIGKDDMYGSHGPRFFLDGMPQSPEIEIVRVMGIESFRNFTMARLFKDDDF